MATIEMSTDLARMITSVLPIGNGGTGQNTAKNGFNSLAAGLGIATGDFNDTTYFITTNNSGATNDYYIRNYSILKSNIKTYLTPNIITSIAYSGGGNVLTALSLSTAGVLTATKGATVNANTNSGTAARLAYYSANTTISAVPNIKFHTGTSSVSSTYNRLHIWGQTYGNDAASMLSGTGGLFSWGDGGPQITFDTSETPGGAQAGALIWTDHDTAGTGVSWHFVSNQGDWNVTSKRFHARTSISIGQNLPNTSYNLYVNGTTYLNGSTTVNGNTLKITNNGNTMTIGSQNSGWAHFYNSANVSFYFDKAVHVNGDVYRYNTNVHMSASGFHPPKNGGIYWDPYVESASDASDVTSIYQIASGVAGGTELRINQQNDSADVINICSPSYIYMNSKRIFTISDSWFRINENSGFSSGIYFGSGTGGVVRTDNQFQVGSSGSKFYANSSGNGYFSNNLTVSGLINNYKLYTGGTFNANDIRTSNGFWIFNAAVTNAPTTNHGALLGIGSVGTPCQFFFPDASYYVYKRYYSSSAWTSWTKIYAGYADSAGTCTGNAATATCATRTGVSVSWHKGRDAVVAKTTTINNYSPTISVKTTNGSWEIGSYNNSDYTDKLIFSYVTDANYNNNTNSHVDFTINTAGNFSGKAANVTGTVAIGNGGTGATSASAARTNLGFKIYTSNAEGTTFSSASTVISYISLPSGINVKNIYGWCLHFTGDNASEVRSYITQVTLYFLDKTNQIAIRMTAGASLTAWYQVKMLVIE